ncbi:ArnT family glycosyltransferase [Halomarina rubra]|uniref:ArnT family glycosyltransferase n=1 Tax=Halomarina rubra TaxID=2071873 RepID=A0ABD6B1C3_9EURY|nr:glycosyltransferase family 39 protein [Halomarina rubra]
MNRPRPDSRLVLASLALLAGVVVFLTARALFPELSTNHDEGVYLQQSAMLLEGKLWLTTDLPGAFRPWFFVEDGTRLYPKYAPMTALVFAPGVALGVPRLVLAVVAAGNVALVGLLAREAFEEWTGVLAAAFALATPFFALISATFLPYAPTTLLNLTFALCYLRSLRRLDAGHPRASLAYALAGGVAVAFAFIARPFTAVLFALPFVGHALWTLGGRLRAAGVFATFRAPVAARLLVVAAAGATGVALTLGYNAVVTGDALLFPYEAFAPLDGLGFGYRRMLHYDRVFTPALALNANLTLLWELATRWTVAAPLGTLLALVGLSTLRDGREPDALVADRTVRVLLAGVALTVAVGNVYFWGSLNVLGGLSDPTDGFMGSYGPFYHFDLLLPLSVFGAAGLRLAVTRGRSWLSARPRLDARQVRVVAIVLVLVAVPVAVGAQVAALDGPVERHTESSGHYERALEPIRDHEFDRGVVFVPQAFGPWLNHPFQSLRNGGSLASGEVLYAQDRDPAGDFAVVDAYSNRTLYRFTYRGEWGPGPRPVTPALQELTVREGTSHTVRTRVGAVGRLSSVRVEAGGAVVARSPDTANDANTHTVRWTVNGTHVSYGDAAIPLDGPEEVSVLVTYVQEGGATLTYRQDVSVDATGESVRVVWPAETRVCRLTTDCGTEGTYLDGAGEYVGGVSVETRLSTEGDETEDG